MLLGRAVPAAACLDGLVLAALVDRRHCIVKEGETACARSGSSWPVAQSGPRIWPCRCGSQLSLPRSSELRDRTAIQASRPCLRCDSEALVILFESADRLLRKTETRYRLGECTDCGLIRLDALGLSGNQPDLGPVPDWWEGVPVMGGRLAETVRRFADGTRLRFIVNSLHVSGPVLDITSDGGCVATALRERGIQVHALEPLPVSSIRQRDESIPLVCFQLSEACFARGSFSAVSALHVIEHLTDPLVTLRSLRELLGDDGRLVIQVPNAESWQALLLGERWNGFDIPRHPVSYREPDIVSLLEASGFEVVRCQRFSLRDDPTGLATSLCPWLDPMIRRLRGVRESAFLGAIKNAIYVLLTIAATPLTLLESVAGAGASLMIEARPRRKGVDDL